MEGIQVHANEGGVTQTRGGIYWVILPAGCNTFLPENLISHCKAFLFFGVPTMLIGHGYETLIGIEVKGQCESVCVSDKYTCIHLNLVLFLLFLNLTLSTLNSNAELWTF